MEIREFENLILSELKILVEDVISNNLELNISARSRAGAEISDFLEAEFVKRTHNHKYFFDSEASPKGATKNPWDVKTFFKLNEHIEEIWIDFKALKISGADSNPDIGTPDKIIKFIIHGYFYLVYIYVSYQEKGTGLEFVKQGADYSKLYFLKDISATFRRNPKNQLQVNMSEPPEYRTREEFIKLLSKKLKESHLRQIEISNRKLAEIEQKEKEMLKQNIQAETNLKKI
jgi:hypothetical protein